MTTIEFGKRSHAKTIEEIGAICTLNQPSLDTVELLLRRKAVHYSESGDGRGSTVSVLES